MSGVFLAPPWKQLVLLFNWKLIITASVCRCRCKKKKKTKNPHSLCWKLSLFLYLLPLSLSPFFPPSRSRCLHCDGVEYYCARCTGRRVLPSQCYPRTSLSTRRERIYLPTKRRLASRSLIAASHGTHWLSVTLRKGAYARWQKHTYAYIMEAPEFRGRGGYYILKRHNIKTGDSELKSGSLRRRESSLNRTRSFKTVTAWIGEKKRKKKQSLQLLDLISLWTAALRLHKRFPKPNRGVYSGDFCAHAKKKIKHSRSMFSRINIVTTEALKGPRWWRCIKPRRRAVTTTESEVL